MQQSGHRKLLTPAQDLPILHYNSYRPHFGYPRNPLPLPAAYGYLPQPIWSQEYRPLSGGPRAIPLRMQRAAMSRTELHQTPIPSLPLSSNRPYSVPTYLNRRIRSDSDSTFTHPPRPATSLDLGTVDKSISPRSTIFSQHGVAQHPKNDLLSSHATTLEDTGLLKGIPRTARPVANRGSRKLPPLSASTAGGSQRELRPVITPFEQRAMGYAAGQKRAASIDGKPNASKRIKFNVILNQSQAASAPRAPNNTTTEEVNQPLEQYNAKVTTEQYLTTTVDNTSPRLSPNKLAKPKAADAPEPNPYDIINGTDVFEDSRSARTVGDVQSARNFKTSDISTNIDTLGAFGASSRGLNIDNRYLNTAYNQHISVTARCGMSSNIVSSEIQTESRKLANDVHSHNLHYGTITTTDDEKEGPCCSENPNIQFSRIEKLLHAQNKDGIDKFIMVKLNSEGTNVLQTLTNELLVGLAVRDIELLEQMAKIM
ncbi:hypothetical protein F4814DRAFT_322565 [Daldinia grandis]|nr:hypothetical protein F4814DRAFT_322565 [Daldinia grandis]